ncbi:MAG: LysM peptidoglycan-binding domain-containing protein [Chloroflexia bacterium]
MAFRSGQTTGDAARSRTHESGAQEATRRGIEALRRGERDAAYDFFHEAARLAPGDSYAWLWLGAISPDLDQAESAFSLAYDLDPNNVQASLGMRWVRLQRRSAITGEARPAITGEAVPVPLEGVASSPSSAAFTTSPLVPVEEAVSGSNAKSGSARGLGALPRSITGSVAALLALVALLAILAANTVWSSSHKSGPVTEVAALEGSGASLSGTESLLTPGPPTHGTATTAVTRAPALVPPATGSPTSTPSKTPIPTATMTVTATHTPTPSHTPSPLPTNTPLSTFTPVPPPPTPTTAPPPPPPPIATPKPRVIPTPRPPGPIRYTVRRGDSLFLIAARFRTTVAAIKAANGLAYDTVFAGQVLTIPPAR